jgi:hypothetical protein
LGLLEWLLPLAPIPQCLASRRLIMRGLVGGALLGLGLVVAGAVGFADAQAPYEAQAARGAMVTHNPMAARGTTHDRAGSSAELLALSHDGGDGRQQITIVDPRQRVMAVYTIERGSGALQLKSVRNLTWDLQIEDYNSGTPAPRDIRALKEQQR